jgi:hypothetical protein
VIQEYFIQMRGELVSLNELTALNIKEFIFIFARAVRVLTLHYV